MKVCEKCGVEFKNYLKVDGKLRNLKNRKFCVSCSPFGSHNTTKLPTRGKCETCASDLTGNQVMFCSTKCKQQTSNFKHQNYECQKARGVLRRGHILDLKGRICCRCGYNKCNSALVFHHLDPATKKFKLDIRHCSNTSLSKLIAEAEKCILLCANCHSEEHWGGEVVGDD
jgi:hypothetical protein